MPAGGRIIALSSLGAHRAMPGYGFIGASKAALESLVRSLAQELGPRGIRVNAVSAGVVDTDALRAFPNRDALLSAFAERAPAGTALTAEEVAATVYLLCLPEAAMVTGHTLVVDGGFWATLDYWLERTEEFNAEDWVPNRIAMIARYDTGLGLRRPIDRYMRSEDPYGTLEFVEFGVGRGEIREDVDVEMIASMLDWLAERFQDALSSEDLDPGLIHRRPERRGIRIKEFVQILQGGIAAGPAPSR
jgi:hypothetical protein